ncbi:centrosomal and chromosomal factor [Drosophila santomea]|uniref:centrosomal and chromosomal factor n=1 Tax=Drosophila santomea TaxID=129105 RepID=UPI0019549147|nr:centrosomal and chromosomal factor [Drosophila santomea]
MRSSKVRGGNASRLVDAEGQWGKGCLGSQHAILKNHGRGLSSQNPAQFGGYSSSSGQQQYPAVYTQPGFRGAGKLKATPNTLLQQQQQQLLAQQQQQLLAATSPQGGASGSAGAGVGVVNMPSYADQMHAAFLDYQRQRAEFEQQQQQLLQKLYHYYPDVSGALSPAQIQSQATQLAAPAADVGGSTVGGVATQSAAGRFAYRRPQFSSNGLQPERLAAGSILHGAGPAGGGVIPGAVPLRNGAVGAGDFYSTQQHMGFMQQQQQDVLRDQQQSVAQQFATSQLAPTTRQSYGMAVPMSSVLGSPTYQQSPDVSHVSFSSGNLNYSF